MSLGKQWRNRVEGNGHSQSSAHVFLGSYICRKDGRGVLSSLQVGQPCAGKTPRRHEYGTGKNYYAFASMLARTALTALPEDTRRDRLSRPIPDSLADLELRVDAGPGDQLTAKRHRQRPYAGRETLIFARNSFITYEAPLGDFIRRTPEASRFIHLLRKFLPATFTETVEGTGWEPSRRRTGY